MVRRVVALLALLLTTAPAAATFSSQSAKREPGVVKAPKDFALRLEFGCSTPDIINTMAGTYTVSGAWPRSAVAQIYVSSKLKDELFRVITDQQFFSMSARVHGLGICEPGTNYTLWVTSGGRSHTVSWSDCHVDPVDDTGVRVRALADGIVKPFHNMGAVKQILNLRPLCL